MTVNKLEKRVLSLYDGALEMEEGHYSNLFFQTFILVKRDRWPLTNMISKADLCTRCMDETIINCNSAKEPNELVRAFNMTTQTTMFAILLKKDNFLSFVNVCLHPLGNNRIEWNAFRDCT